MEKSISEMNDDELLAYHGFCESMAVKTEKEQHAIKILINSLYGGLGSPYFRMYNMWMAEGITLSGQTVLDTAYDAVNTYFNKLLSSNSDWAIAGDTDSGYFDLSMIVKKFVNPGDDPVEFLDRMGNTVIKKKLDAAYEDLKDRTNAFVNRINMKREAIGQAVFVAKKNYVMMVYDNEGTRYSEPKMKMTGVEAIKSSTPKYFRDKLKDGYRLAFQEVESKFHDYVAGVYTEYMKKPPEELSAATSVTALEEKYPLENGAFAKGTPFNTKAAITYNRLIESKGLLDKYYLIKPGDKIRILKLVVPNPFGGEYIAYSDKYPEELDIDRWINRNESYDKFFINPIMRVFSKLGWNHEETNSVNDLFG